MLSSLGDVADRCRGNVVLRSSRGRPSVVDSKVDPLTSCCPLFNHDRHIVKYTDRTFVTNVIIGHNWAFKAIRNRGLARWCTRNLICVGNILLIVEESAGLAFNQGIGGAITSIQIQDNLSKSHHALCTDFNFVSRVDLLFSIAYFCVASRIVIFNSHHANFISENLFDRECDIFNVLR